MPVRSIAPDPFDLLGVSEHSSDEVINAAWRRRIRVCHPDHAVDDADRERREAESIALNRAHDTLLDPELKAQAILDRRDRTGPTAQPAYTPAEPPPAQPRRQDTWAGTRWSRYRAGGHPEARDAWTYREPATPPPATPAPQGYASLLARSPTPVRVVLIALQILVSTVWAPMKLLGSFARHTLCVSDPFYPISHYHDEDG
jgi:curved DNA-binding protein CbpA